MRNSIFGVAIFASLISVLPASAAPEEASGTIVSYECGDNCYLTIMTKDGEEITALCAAVGCRVWNDEAAMPEELIDRGVTVTMGTGQQFDGSGNNMGDFSAFTSLVVDEQ